MSGLLSTFVANTPAVWGNDLTNTPITNQAGFNTAISALRSYNGRTPFAYAWPNPLRWAGFEQQMSGTGVGATGNSIEAVVQQLQAVNVEPLLVFAMPCNQFRFSSLDPTTAAYWGERWCALRQVDSPGGMECRTTLS